MANLHTPTSHGAWRVIDNQLVDESTLPPHQAETPPSPVAPLEPLAEMTAPLPPSPRRKARHKPE
jgi:hypothetical protein